MTTPRKILIVGGGISGMCAAIQLRKLDYDVHLVETDPQWRMDGAGITINGPCLRALKEVGVLEQVMAQAGCSDNLSIALANGQVVTTVPTPRVAGPDIPSAAGILRPVLAAILAEKTRASGARISLGTSYTALEDRGDRVEAEFTDGTQGSYDLVVAADGVMSATRARFMPHAPTPKFTGQGSWRAVVPRHPSVNNVTLYMGKTTKAGVNPVSDREMYLFALDHQETDAHIPREDWHPRMVALLGEFSGVVGELRDGLNPASRIIYRPLHNLIVPKPWHVGRIVFIGDTMHATTPHLASGAGMGVEDAIVLAQELDAHEDVQAAFIAFAERRFERCRMVVEGSARLGELENIGTEESKREHMQVTRYVTEALAAAI
jgi:2-polyprenyl-6-methoxyphenol hydroxylase-like FAD-dependent oxidoreductase